MHSLYFNQLVLDIIQYFIDFLLRTIQANEDVQVFSGLKAKKVSKSEFLSTVGPPYLVKHISC